MVLRQAALRNFPRFCSSSRHPNDVVSHAKRNFPKLHSEKSGELKYGLGEHFTSDLTELLARNKAWSTSKLESNPSYFKKTSAQQSPKILWLGCSDSRVPETQIFNAGKTNLHTHQFLF